MYRKVPDETDLVCYCSMSERIHIGKPAHHHHQIFKTDGLLYTRCRTDRITTRKCPAYHGPQNPDYTEIHPASRDKLPMSTLPTPLHVIRWWRIRVVCSCASRRAVSTYVLRTGSTFNEHTSLQQAPLRPSRFSPPCLHDRGAAEYSTVDST
jgi:hypothetical protein